MEKSRAENIEKGLEGDRTGAQVNDHEGQKRCKGCQIWFDQELLTLGYCGTCRTSGAYSDF